jgi:hypothetical protein
MLGQLRGEPEPDALEPDDPEPVLLDPEFELLEPDDGVVVEELVLLPEPVEPAFEVVAASATNAPPATSPAVNAPVASALRNRIFIWSLSFRFVECAAPFGEVFIRCAPDLWPGAQRPQRAGCVS